MPIAGWAPWCMGISLLPSAYLHSIEKGSESQILGSVGWLPFSAVSKNLNLAERTYCPVPLLTAGLGVSFCHNSYSQQGHIPTSKGLHCTLASLHIRRSKTHYSVKTLCSSAHPRLKVLQRTDCTALIQAHWEQWSSPILLPPNNQLWISWWTWISQPAWVVLAQAVLLWELHLVLSKSQTGPAPLGHFLPVRIVHWNGHWKRRLLHWKVKPEKQLLVSLQQFSPAVSVLHRVF